MRPDRRTVTAGGLAMLIPRMASALDVRVFIADGEKVTGPFDEAGLRDRIASRTEAADTLVWHQGMTDWAPATEVPALAALIASLPAETAMDFAALIVGRWRDDAATLMAEDDAQGGERAIPGWVQMTFRDDRTYTSKAYAQWVSRFYQPAPTRPPMPGQVPVRPPMQLVDNTVTFRISGSGKYRVHPVDARRFDLDLIGLNKITTNGKPEEPKAIDVTMRFTMQGTDRLMSEHGETFHRRSL